MKLDSKKLQNQSRVLLQAKVLVQTVQTARQVQVHLTQVLAQALMLQAQVVVAQALHLLKAITTLPAVRIQALVLQIALHQIVVLHLVVVQIQVLQKAQHLLDRITFITPVLLGE